MVQCKNFCSQEAGITQPLDSRIVEKINDLVNEGSSNVREIERTFASYVKFELFKDEQPPTSSNRRFYPIHKDIRNHHYKAYTRNKLVVLDQDNVAKLVEQFKGECKADDEIFFHPYLSSAGTNNREHIDDHSNGEICKPKLPSEQTLLLIHQMEWQKRLLFRYGQEICLMDATYKTSKCSVPLFFIIVKSNVGSEAVASFVIRNESEEGIAEALHILKQWNPTFFMTDKSQAEINAIEKVFKGNE